MAVNTWDGSSSTDWGTAANWTTTGVTDRVPTADDDVVIPDCSSINNCILDGDTTINSLELAASSNFSMNNHDLTIDGENGSGRAIDVGSNTLTFVGGTGTLIFTLGSGTTKLQGIQHLAASTELRNVQFNGGATFQLEGDTTITGNLTISAGTLTTLDSDGSTSRNLTVTGDVDITGTLTGNASAISLGSLTINSGGTYSATSGTTTITSFINNKSIVNNSGTFTHNSGTVVIDVTNSNKTMVDARATYHNLTINSDGSNKEVELNNQAATIEGNLTVQEGKLFTYATSGRHLTVTGDVSIEDGGEIEMNDVAGKNATFGSLEIQSGGTYNATSGTTTITNRNSNAKYWENGGGTFTHNNGTVKFTDNDHSGIVENTFYNMHIASANANHYAVSWEDVSGNALKVLNNLIIESGDFELATAGDTLDVYGKTIIDNSLAGGTPNNAYARFNNDKNQTGTITHHGIVEIISGTYHVEDGATVNMAGIRNVGGLVD